MIPDENASLMRFAPSQIEGWISASEVFADASVEVLRQLAGQATMVELKPGEVLFTRGDDAHSMYIVASGRVSVHIDAYELSELREGSLIGEYALVDEQPRSATVTAKCATLLVELSKSRFLEVLENNTRFCFAVMKLMIRRSRRMNELEEKLASSFREIQKQNVELLQLNSEKNTLIDLVAHDLRNPLTSSKCAVEMLRDQPGNLTADQADYVKLIDNALVRMKTIVNQILDVEVIESRQLRVNLHPQDISQILKEVTDGLQGFARQKNIAVVTVAEPVVAATDRSFLTQVFDNLVSNAIKYSPLGSEIVIRLSQHLHYVKFEVQDQGPGISSGEMATLFSRYRRGSANPTAGESSLGLGLSIVKKLVTALHGEVYCESGQEAGSRFVVILPQ